MGRVNTQLGPPASLGARTCSGIPREGTSRSSPALAIRMPLRRRRTDGPIRTLQSVKAKISNNHLSKAITYASSGREPARTVVVAPMPHAALAGAELGQFPKSVWARGMGWLQVSMDVIESANACHSVPDSMQMKAPPRYICDSTRLLSPRHTTFFLGRPTRPVTPASVPTETPHFAWSDVKL